MTQKVRKILIAFVMTALIICLMAASLTYTFTYGRYAGGKFDNENSPYGDLIEFVGANQYIVRTPEELIQAIKDGYSNIKIADDAEKPFVIDTGVTDVSANLVLDLNGTNVIRNSRNPLLDVKEEVSVVLVYDSSKTAGSFYNPVGSNLQVSGGTLTVAVGDYISGPEKEEYNTETTSAKDVTLFARNDPDRADSTGYTPDSEVGALPDISTNKYFEEVDTGTTFNGTYIKDDTFLLYTIEKDCFVEGNTLYTNAEKTAEDGSEVTVVTGEALTVACNVASCDFYYYYPTVDDDDDGYKNYAVIYGYNDVKTLAEGQYNESTKEYKSFYNQADLVWPYAAVRMVESDNAAQDDNAAQGECFARGGQFSNNFDTVNTYGIYAESGSLVASGNVKFSTGGDGVCIRCEGSASLSISGGTYSSAIGNTIEMSDGKMTVTAGTFTKSAARSDGNNQIANQTAIIDMQGGKLEIKGAGADSVTMKAGSEDNGGTLENVFGILARGGGEVSVGGCTLNIYGDYSAGVLSYNGEINLGDDTDIKVTQSNEFTDTNNNNILLTSAGVSSEGGTINLTGNVTIESDGLGITARGTVKVTGGTTSTVTTSRGTGIYVNNGSFTVDSRAAITVNSTVKSDYSWATPPGNTATNTPNIYNGVYVQGGSLDSKGTLKVTFTGVQNDAPAANADGDSLFRTFEIKSYAVRVEGDANTTVTIASGNITNSVGGGILVNGGSVTLGSSTSNSGPTVQTTGTGYHHNENNDAAYRYRPAFSKARNWYYYLPSTGGSAVKVDGGTLTVYGGDYSATQGDGIVTVNGTTTIRGGSFRGNDNYTTEEGSSQAGPGASYAFKVYGGTANVYAGTFGGQFNNVWSKTSGAFVMGISPTSTGTANIYGGTFEVGGGNNGDEGGQAGFSVYQYATVNFAPQDSSEISVKGRATAIAIEQTADNSNSAVTISGGMFASTSTVLENSDGIWYSNSNATLKISGGTFTGAARSGLYFEANPGNNVQLSGGTYYGHSSEQYDWKVTNGNQTWYNNGSIGSTVRSEYDWVYRRVGVGHDLHLNAIIAAGCNVYENNVQIYAGTNNGSICDTISKCDVVVIR